MFGERKDCTPISDALHSCMFWLQRKDVQELVRKKICLININFVLFKQKNLISYEEDRLIRRKLSSENNDVWESRTQPPSDWNAPLPDWAKKRAESIGKYKQKEAQQIFCYCFLINLDV